MTILAVLTVLAVLESTLPSFCLSYHIQYQETTVAVLAVVAVSVVTATPLKLNPLFRDPDMPSRFLAIGASNKTSSASEAEQVERHTSCAVRSSLGVHRHIHQQSARSLILS